MLIVIYNSLFHLNFDMDSNCDVLVVLGNCVMCEGGMKAMTQPMGIQCSPLRGCNSPSCMGQCGGQGYCQRQDDRPYCCCITLNKTPQKTNWSTWIALYSFELLLNELPMFLYKFLMWVPNKVVIGNKFMFAYFYQCQSIYQYDVMPLK
jgi:hypothetical protein